MIKIILGCFKEDSEVSVEELEQEKNNPKEKRNKYVL